MREIPLTKVFAQRIARKCGAKQTKTRISQWCETVLCESKLWHTSLSPSLTRNQKSCFNCISAATSKAPKTKPFCAALSTRICPESICQSCGMHVVPAIRQIGFLATSKQASNWLRRLFVLFLFVVEYQRDIYLRLWWYRATAPCPIPWTPANQIRMLGLPEECYPKIPNCQMRNGG